MGLLFEGQPDVPMPGQHERFNRAENPSLINGVKLSYHRTFIVSGSGSDQGMADCGFGRFQFVGVTIESH